MVVSSRFYQNNTKTYDDFTNHVAIGSRVEKKSQAAGFPPTKFTLTMLIGREGNKDFETIRTYLRASKMRGGLKTV